MYIQYIFINNNRLLVEMIVILILFVKNDLLFNVDGFKTFILPFYVNNYTRFRGLGRKSKNTIINHTNKLCAMKDSCEQFFIAYQNTEIVNQLMHDTHTHTTIPC